MFIFNFKFWIGHLYIVGAWRWHASAPRTNVDISDGDGHVGGQRHEHTEEGNHDWRQTKGPPLSTSVVILVLWQDHVSMQRPYEFVFCNSDQCFVKHL